MHRRNLPESKPRRPRGFGGLQTKKNTVSDSETTSLVSHTYDLPMNLWLFWSLHVSQSETIKEDVAQEENKANQSEIEKIIKKK